MSKPDASIWSKEFWVEETRKFLFGAGGSSGFSVSTMEWLGERLRLAKAWETRIGYDPNDVSELHFTAPSGSKSLRRDGIE